MLVFNESQPIDLIRLKAISTDAIDYLLTIDFSKEKKSMLLVPNIAVPQDLSIFIRLTNQKVVSNGMILSSGQKELKVSINLRFEAK